MHTDALSDIYCNYLSRGPFCQESPHTYRLHSEAGDGLIRRFTTFGGIEIVYSHIQYNRSYPTSFASKGQLLELQFALSGQRHVTVDRQDYTLPEGEASFIFLQDFKARFYPPAAEPYVSFALGIPVELFHYALSRLSSQTPTEFRHILDGHSFRALPFRPEDGCMAAVRRLTIALTEAHLSPLGIEAAALEIVDQCLLRLFEPIPSPEGFTREDVRRLREAREIVESRLIAPPSLLELARQVGLNDFKLKKGFKACFGTTVFEHLREIRLERAMMLLRTGESVTGTAMAVGYSNPSAFSQQFCRRYGIRPSEVRRRS